MLNLAKYDWILINSSAGKDSQAMLDEVARLAREQGVLNRVVVVHCDLGQSEWPGTRELAKEHARHYGLRFEVVRNSKRTLMEAIRERRKWPGPQTRYCTSDFKRGPVRVLCTALSREKTGDSARYLPPVRILDCLGLRAEESSSRAKKPILKTIKRNSRQRIDQWLPIHGWTTEEVWARIHQAGTGIHPAYALGMPRLSCVFCIFAPRPALMLAARHNPELFQEYLGIEREIGHTFRPELSLQMVDDALRAGETVGAMTDRWNM